jgi:hypothetical protein
MERLEEKSFASVGDQTPVCRDIILTELDWLLMNNVRRPKRINLCRGDYNSWW